MTSNTYDGSSIQVLEGLAAVRKRPGMYIGGTGEAAWHHCLWEVIDNSIDEHLGGFCDKINVTLNQDGSVTVEDNGRGIPVEPHKSETFAGVPTIQVAMTQLHAGGKFDSNAYAVSGGLHGVGISVVNALSRWVRAEVKRGGKKYQIGFSTQMIEQKNGTHVEKYGEVSEPLHVVKENLRKSDTGTTITFQLETDVFTAPGWDRNIIEQRMRDWSYLNPKLTLTLNDLRDADEPFHQTYHSPDGLLGLSERRGKRRLAKMEAHRAKNAKNKENEPVAPILDPKHPVVLSGSFDNPQETWEVCIQWYGDASSETASFANAVRTVSDGAHVDGALQPLARVLNAWAKRTKMLKRREQLTSADVRTGIDLLVSVKIADPQFEGQTKGKLNNDEVRSGMVKGVGKQFESWLNQNPTGGVALVNAALKANRIRSAIEDAAKKAQDKEEKPKIAPATRVAIQSKITDCVIEDPSFSEIHVVEGDSAAGTGIQARDPNYQAILPLRGVPINILTRGRARSLKNAEVQMILMALGTGYGKDYDDTKRRFNKLIILTDADYDGKHIQLLLLAMLWELVPDFVTDGHLYIAKTPLWSTTLKVNGEYEPLYAYSDDEKNAYAELWSSMKDGADNTAARAFVKNKNINSDIAKAIIASSKRGSLYWERFKGLGEMEHEDLRTAAFNPETRKLTQVTAENAELATQKAHQLIGPDTARRKSFVQEVIIPDSPTE